MNERGMVQTSTQVIKIMRSTVRGTILTCENNFDNKFFAFGEVQGCIFLLIFFESHAKIFIGILFMQKY